MSFGYLAGITTAGAADEIVDWFATFEAWIVGLGWTVEAGAGTTNLVLRSVSEAGGLTMLYLHVWRDPGNPNRVKIEVRDDLAGTHETTCGGYLDGAGAQFPFWMCGDMDAIDMCFRGGGTYHTVYAGLLVPWALTVPDETYRMIATYRDLEGTILRDWNGVWDVNGTMYANIYMEAAAIDDYDGSFPLAGVYFNRQADIAGQLKHRSCSIQDPGINVGETLETGRPGATTTWIVVEDRYGYRHAMRTGGVLPTGPADPASFAAVSGVAGGLAALWTALSTHLTGLGWTDHGYPGILDDGRLYSSTGESGQDEIYIGYAWANAAPDLLCGYVQNDLAGTHKSDHVAGDFRYLDLTDFPLNYWICGDKDCCVLVWQRGAAYSMIWSGLVTAFAPGILPPYAGPPPTVYQLFWGARGAGPTPAQTSGLLRARDGTWDPFIGSPQFAWDVLEADNSNPSNFDGVTYFVWPMVARYNRGFWAGSIMLGQLRYIGYSSGGGIANLDTITIGPEVYTVFFDSWPTNFCVRRV